MTPGSLTDGQRVRITTGHGLGFDLGGRTGRIVDVVTEEVDGEPWTHYAVAFDDPITTVHGDYPVITADGETRTAIWCAPFELEAITSAGRCSAERT